MKPAPTMATRIGLSWATRACRAVSTRITATFPLLSSLSGRRTQTTGASKLPIAMNLRAAVVHPTFHFGFDLVEQCKLLILVRDYSYWQWPLQSKARIVMPKSAFDIGRIKLANL